MRISDWSADVCSSDLLSYAENNEQHYEAGIGGMFNDSFGARLAVLSQSRDGELENTYLDRDENPTRQKAARLKLRSLPTDDVQIDYLAQIASTHLNLSPYKMFDTALCTLTYRHPFKQKFEESP